MSMVIRYIGEKIRDASLRGEGERREINDVSDEHVSLIR